MFKSIELANFKSFKNFSYSCARLNLLTGLNGSGKSSFIQALRSICLCRDKGIDSPTHMKLPLRRVGLIDQNDLFYAYNQEDAQVVAQLDDSCFALEFHRTDKDDDSVVIDQGGDAPSPRMRFLSSDRCAVTEEGFDDKGEVNGVCGEGTLSGLRSDCSETMIVDPVLRRDGCDSGDLQNQLNAWLCVVSPDAYYCFGDDSERVHMYVGYSEGDSRAPLFRASNVGYGISYVYPMLLLLLTARSDDVIVIENPEAHLHPRGQAMIGELIARAVAAGAQLFVETHSDHVINGMRVAVKKGIVKPQDVNIGFFDCREHEVYGETCAPTSERWTECTNIKVDKNGSLSNYPDAFMDEWTNQMRDLLS